MVTVTNKELLEAIEMLGQVVTKTTKITNDRISNIINLLTIKENEEKPVEKTATNEAGNSTVGPGIIMMPVRPKPETPVEEGAYVAYGIFERETEKAEMYSNCDDPKLITWVPKSVIKTYDAKLCKLTLISKYALDKYIKWVVKTS